MFRIRQIVGSISAPQEPASLFLVSVAFLRRFVQIIRDYLQCVIHSCTRFSIPISVWRPDHSPLERHIRTCHMQLKHLLYSPAVTICTTHFNAPELGILPTDCIFVFRMILAINSDCFPKPHKPVWLCIGDVMCFL
jgi:hypothetical protein